MTQDCTICERIAMIEDGTNPYFVAELQTGYVVVGDEQFFHGYSLLLCKQHVFELHELEPTFKIEFLTEMSLLAEAVYRAFDPIKLNYELLGNHDPHPHWHIFPRHIDEPHPYRHRNFSMQEATPEQLKPSPDTINEVRYELLAALRQVAGDRIIRHFES